MVKIREEYYKRSRPGYAPINYTCRGKRSTQKVTSAFIRKDPSLKSHPKLEKAIMRHEMTEIRLRAKGMPVDKAHRIARSKELALTRNLSLKQLWKKLKQKEA